MPCDNCDRLRIQLREALEELDEWRRSDQPSQDSVSMLRRAFGLGPQGAIIVDCLMRSSGCVVHKEALIEAMQYRGEDRHPEKGKPDNVAALHVVVCKAKSALRSSGVFEAVVNIPATGYIMPRTKAAEIRKLMEEHQ